MLPGRNDKHYGKNGISMDLSGSTFQINDS